MTDNNMAADSLISLGSAIGATATYYFLGFLEDAGTLPGLSFLEKSAGGVGVGVVLFFVLRWSLKRNDAQAAEIQRLNDERVASYKETIKALQEHNEVLKK